MMGRHFAVSLNAWGRVVIDGQGLGAEVLEEERRKEKRGGEPMRRTILRHRACGREAKMSVLECVEGA